MITFKEYIRENNSQPTKFGHLVKLGTKMEDADFWVHRVHSPNKVGHPTTEYQPHHIGVKVTRPDLLNPRFAFYWMQHVANTGYFASRATGMSDRVNIKKSDIHDIPIQFKGE